MHKNIDKQTEALSVADTLKLALKDLERSESAMHKARAIIREALAEQPPCKTGSQCTSKCPQCDEPVPPPECKTDAEHLLREKNA